MYVVLSMGRERERERVRERESDYYVFLSIIMNILFLIYNNRMPYLLNQYIQYMIHIS